MAGPMHLAVVPRADEDFRSWAKRVRGSRRFRAVAQQAIAAGRAAGAECFRCHAPIDYTLAPTTAWGPTAEHTVPLRVLWAQGDEGAAWDPTLLAVSHRRCNTAFGPGRAVRQASAKRAGEPSAPGVVVALPPTLLDGPANLARDLPALAASMPADARPPRLMSPRHPRTAGTFADAAIPWVEGWLGHPLFWHQQLIITRLLEHDDEGRLVHPWSAVTMPRQSGKTRMMQALHAWLLERGREVLGREARALVMAAELRQSTLGLDAVLRHWEEARANGVQGIRTSRRTGAESVETPRGDWLRATSQRAMGLGFSATSIWLDEAHGIEPAAMDGLMHTLSAATGAHVWVTSTAALRPTGLVPKLRADAAAGECLLIEWSIGEDADPRDPAVYRAAAPVWSDWREALAVRAVRANPASAAVEVGNRWPPIGGDLVGPVAWPSGWESAPKVEGPPPRGAVVAVEASRDMTEFALAVTTAGGLWLLFEPDIDSVRNRVRQLLPTRLLAGATFAEQLKPQGAVAFGSRDEVPALGMFVREVDEGRLAHEHSPKMLEQARSVRTFEAEAGTRMTRRGSGDVHGMRAAMFAVWDRLARPTVRGRVW